MRELVARLICLIKGHIWDTNVDGYSGDEWNECHRCGKNDWDTLKVWDGEKGVMRPATKTEILEAKK